MIDLRDSTAPEILVAAHVLARLDAAAREAEIDYIVVGATARTMLGMGLLGLPPERATRDIDIATAVATWSDFERLTEKLQKLGPNPHSFVVEGVEVDVVPYGGIESHDRTILWPNDHRMNVRGLTEAVESAETVLLPGALTVRVPSIPAMAMLKLLTWRDRRASTTRDAVDLGAIISWYSSGPYLDRLYAANIDILAAHDFDPAPAGAWLLGSHIAQLLDQEGLSSVCAIVDDEETLAQLAADTGMPWPRRTELMAALADGIHGTARRTGG